MRKFVIKVNNQQFEVEVEEVKNKSANSQSPVTTTVSAPKPSTNGKETTISAAGEKILSPMPGNILKVNVQNGDVVKKGQVLLVLEAMKMENDITAPADGKVTAIKVEKGQSIQAGEVLVILG
jgi:glutaconyl-CoA/methylmalonyl-CoA decarboxylase subunit gamma